MNIWTLLYFSSWNHGNFSFTCEKPVILNCLWCYYFIFVGCAISPCFERATGRIFDLWCSILNACRLRQVSSHACLARKMRAPQAGIYIYFPNIFVALDVFIRRLFVVVKLEIPVRETLTHASMSKIIAVVVQYICMWIVIHFLVAIFFQTLRFRAWEADDRVL